MDRRRHKRAARASCEQALAANQLFREKEFEMSSNVPVFTEASTSKFVRIKQDHKDGQLDVQLHYNDAGQGAETVVMLHGSGPGASGWANFNRNVEPLVNAGYRGILMDCLGWSRRDPIVCDGSRSELNARSLKGLLD